MGKGDGLGGLTGKRKGKDRIARRKEDQNRLHGLVGRQIMKPTKHYLKNWGEKGGENGNTKEGVNLFRVCFMHACMEQVE
jgi:hypothetical protein